MRQLAAVVIPVYKDNLSAYEEIALKQIDAVLKDHPKVFFMPDGEKPAYAARYGYETVRFKKEFFSDVHGYNRLLLSSDFYEKFLKYENILIAQPDSFVFSDELNAWCGKKYDYAGAPWVFEVGQYAYTREYLPFLHRYPFLKKLRKFFDRDFLVGNGGFSLRRTETFLKILKDHPKRVENFNRRSAEFLARGIFTAGHEDNFWGLHVPAFFKGFKVPGFREALKFSFEVGPELCYEKNGGRLPFGCHGWQKHGPDFWAPFVRQYGHAV